MAAEVCDAAFDDRRPLHHPITSEARRSCLNRLAFFHDLYILRIIVLTFLGENEAILLGDWT